MATRLLSSLSFSLTRILLEWANLILGIATFALYSTLSMARFLQMDAGIDLAIFGQAVKAYSHGGQPWSHIKGNYGFNLLGDHFSPIVALAAPLYAVVPHAWILLILQAALIAVTTLLIASLARRRFGTLAGVCVGVIYALAWGTQGLAMFDFHEVAFALPLVAMVYRSLYSGRETAAVLWSLPLMLVKEDSVFLILGVVLVLLVRKKWKHAIWLFVYGVVSFLVIVAVIIPEFSYYGEYTYWGSSAAGGGANFLGGAINSFAQSFTSGQALLLLFVLFVPTLGIALRSPLVLGIVPPLLSRLTSPESNYWGTNFHYNATITVIIVVAFIDGISRLGWSKYPRRFALVLAAGVVASLVLSIFGPAAQFVKSTAAASCDDECRRNISYVLTTHIPDGAQVAAADTIAAYLVDRADVYGLHQGIVDSSGAQSYPLYIVVDRFNDQGWQAQWGNDRFQDPDHAVLGEAVHLGDQGLKDYDYIVIQSLYR